MKTPLDKLISTNLCDIEGLEFVVDGDGQPLITLLSLCRVTGKKHHNFMKGRMPGLLRMHTFKGVKLATVTGRNNIEIQTYLLNQKQAIIVLGYINPAYTIHMLKSQAADRS